MKKLLLTAVIACFGYFASAQIMVVTTYVDEAADGTEIEGADRLTQKMGVGYTVNDKIAVGFTKDGDEDYAVFFRYTIKDDIYAVATMPTEDGSDKMKLGLGYSFNVWQSLYFEPSYTMPIKEDAVTGDRKGEFNFGLGYRF
tara:strand:- start:527 stop:952 length:426 start_codon:yes stop_codon:yes gene_type:complete